MEIRRENRIQLVPSLQHWSVVGSCGVIYVVYVVQSWCVEHDVYLFSIYPVRSHILAAMYSTDCEMKTKRKGKYNRDATKIKNTPVVSTQLN